MVEDKTVSKPSEASRQAFAEWVSRWYPFGLGNSATQIENAFHAGWKARKLAQYKTMWKPYK